tara:strand:+ start:383 stop:1546 length:1164 start_codon:yes stop_codon:yes gene_type:complete
MAVADLISVEEAYGRDPVTGEMDLEKFRQFSEQQERIQANKPQASREMQYLAANSDVMRNAKARLAAAAQENPDVLINPAGATAFIENVAREHYLNFGKQEGREGFGILDPRMESFAAIMANTYDMDDPGTEGGMRPEFYTGASTVEDMGKFTSGINPRLYDRLIDRGYGDWNENKAPGRVDEVMRYMFAPTDEGNTGFNMYGGEDDLFEAYSRLGVTGEGRSYADKHTRDLLDLVKKYQIATASPSINPDNTGGAGEISLGGPTGTGYDSVQQMIADMPNWSQQLAVVPSPNPLSILNALYNMYTGDINRNPWDTSDATGTRPDRSVPSPMEFGTPPESQMLPSNEALRRIIANRRYDIGMRNPGWGTPDDPLGPFGGFGSGGGGE